MSARSFLAFLAVLAVVGLLGFGLLSKGNTTIAVGDPVPDRVLPALPGPGHGSIADHRGNWVLVNLWASWCLPCREEAPALERFYRRQQGNGVTVVGINVQDNRDDALAFLASHPTTYPQLRSVGDERSDAFGSTGVPENFLVDPRGRLALIWRGPVDDRFLRERVVPLIEGQAVRRLASLAVVVLGLLALAAPAAGAAPAPQTTVHDVEDEVMCPICGTLLELSDSPQAEREKVYVGQAGRRRQDQGGDQGRARRPVRPSGSGPARGIAASTSPPTWSRCSRSSSPRSSLAFSVARWRRDGNRSPPGGQRSAGATGRGRQATRGRPRPLRPLDPLALSRSGRGRRRAPAAASGSLARSTADESRVGVFGKRPQRVGVFAQRRAVDDEQVVGVAQLLDRVIAAFGVEQRHRLRLASPATMQASGSVARPEAGPARTSGWRISGASASPRRYSRRPGVARGRVLSASAGSGKVALEQGDAPGLGAAAAAARPSATTDFAGPVTSTAR